MTSSEEIKELRDALGILIIWIAQSGNSPLSQTEASILLKKLEVKLKPVKESTK